MAKRTYNDVSVLAPDAAPFDDQCQSCGSWAQPDCPKCGRERHEHPYLARSREAARRLYEDAKQCR